MVITSIFYADGMGEDPEKRDIVLVKNRIVSQQSCVLKNGNAKSDIDILLIEIVTVMSYLV